MTVLSEQLVLEGYRSWCAGRVHTDLAFRESALNTYWSELEKAHVDLLLSALCKFSNVLGVCATCRLKTSPVGSPFIGKYEVLILGLLSGLQHDNELAVTLCLDQLTCPWRFDEVSSAAEALSTTLRCIGRILTPIHADTIKLWSADVRVSNVLQ